MDQIKNLIYYKQLLRHTKTTEEATFWYETKQNAMLSQFARDAKISPLIKSTV